MPSPNSDREASASDIALARLGCWPCSAEMNWLKNVVPMPTMTASTITLIPDETTLPSTRSARNAVLPHSAKGTSTKPASVVSLNSRMVMKSCTARMKKDSTTTIQANSRTTIVTKLLKKVVKPMSVPACCSSGQAAWNPVPASLPGLSRSAAVNPLLVAWSPSVENELKMTIERVEKLLMMKAKLPT